MNKIITATATVFVAVACTFGGLYVDRLLLSNKKQEVVASLTLPNLVVKELPESSTGISVPWNVGLLPNGKPYGYRLSLIHI